MVRADELDLYIGLTKTLGAVDVSVGYTKYTCSRVQAMINTEEVFHSVCRPSSLVVSGLALTYYEDVDAIERRLP